jgi:DNA-binding winged helix-turn-helix (wHTH) protein/tetratricopeptide (TPR) repeat protein
MSGARVAEEESRGSFAARRWLFGQAVLDERSLTLRVADEPVELERKPLEVLLHLLHHAGEVVTKDELLAAVWPGRVLSDSALTSCMHKLRESLRDDAQDIIRTQHGYGYRLVAPVKIEASVAPPAPRFDFKDGDRPPLRPQWSLVKRLGAGGQGEAWLARHDKTREARVFKFAADVDSLSSLKREITLSRLLHDALGERAASMARVLDWNLEEAPYFVESAYSADGSLVDWAQARGGLRAVPLADRVELAAQVGEALAAAHSVGVLHKDLKPSNVLVDAADGPARIKLSDFGSGGVVDVQRLEQLGITRMGFTQALPADGTGSGTPLYLAPEVIAGQPFTMQSDVYALGVVLYQLVVGDLGKSLAPGWERDVEDELLREDIAAAAEGDPAQRLADAASLTLRLRSLDARRRARVAERTAAADAARARTELERIRARRLWVRLALAASLTGAAVSSWLYVQAREAAATTEAVSDFLNNDVLSSADPWRNPIRTMTVKDALDRAAREVPQRFADRPEVEARLAATIGNVYLRTQEYARAKAHLERAVTLLTQLEGPDAEPRLAALESLGNALRENGSPQEACVRFTEVLDRRRAIGSAAPKLLQARYDVAMCKLQGEDIVGGQDELKLVLRDLEATGIVEEELSGSVKAALADAYGQTGALGEAERLHREVLAALEQRFGAHHLRVALQRQSLALLLDKTGNYSEAGKQLEQGLRDLTVWVGDTQSHAIEFLALLGNVRFREGRLDEAARLLEDAIARAKAAHGPVHDSLAQLPVILARVYREQRRPGAAVAVLRPALVLSRKLQGPEHRFSLDAGIALVAALREAGDRKAAWASLQAISPGGLAALPPKHYLYAAYLRQKGLLLSADGRTEDARAALGEALAIYEHAAGPDHPVTGDVRAELARLPGPGA